MWIVQTTISGELNEAEVGMWCQSIIDSNLASCVDLKRTNSVFRWEGEIQTNSETILILKTTSEKLASLIDKLKKIHSYECPCVLAINIKKGNSDFLDWITHEVQ